MKPYAELLEFNQPNMIRHQGFTRIRDQFPELENWIPAPDSPSNSIPNAERIMEFAGRWDYGQNNARKLGEMSKMRVPAGDKATWTVDKQQLPATMEVEVPIIQKYVSMGHESMIEMGDATFFIECSRGVSHELVRHRPCSYQQESQRFVKYEHEDMADLFYIPPELDDNTGSVEDAKAAYSVAFEAYLTMRDNGVAPQIARYVLPNAMRTRLIMKTNAREWRHILKLRLDRSAQPEMQELMQQIHDQLVDIFPNAMKGVLDGERGVR